jgi:hypothetical protein
MKLAQLALLASVLLLTGLAHADDPYTGRMDRESSPQAMLPRDDADILWDISHGPIYGYEPADQFFGLVQVLEGEGFTVATTEVGVLGEDLTQYGVLVICLGSSHEVPYSLEEVAAIQDFVAAGGGLLVMGDNPDTPNENIEPITTSFGIHCGVAEIMEPVLTDFIAHEIFAGVEAVQLGAAGELGVDPPAVAAAFSDSGQPAIALTDPCGVIVTGDINWADNSLLGMGDNAQLAVNIFQYLAACGGVATADRSWSHLKALYR